MLVTISMSLYEFAFSIIVLTLRSLDTMFGMTSRRREKMWLAFAFTQVSKWPHLGYAFGVVGFPYR
jgi:hypothetical protein